MKFSELDLDPKVLQAVEEAGYETPTPIQAQAIPEALKGRDVLGIAQTGTGKTAAFTMPMIHLLAKGRARARMPRSLILCPTRELAAQVAENFETYGKYHKLSMALLIGGVNFANQDKLIDRGVDVLIATPGRLLDHFERGKLMLTGIQVMVVDEADRMLDMGFIPDLERIFSLTPFTRQTLFFSATMPPEITRLTEQFLHTPVRIEVARQATTAETVDQGLFQFRPSRRDLADREKRALLRAMIDGEGEKFRNAIIFSNRKRDVGVLFKSLEKHGYNCGALHGDLDQSVRTATLNAFRDGTIKILVASDVAARGLDIPNVSHVFNFDLPMHAEDYVHRIGRTGRAGRDGTALSIAAPSDDKYLAKIEELIGKEIPRRPLPEGFRQAAPAAEGEETETRGRKSERGGRRGRKAEPKPEKVEEPMATERRDQPKPQAERREQPKPQAEDKPRKDKRGGGRGKNEPVVGLGDHVPEFLLRPVPIRSTRKSAKSSTAADKDKPDEQESEAA